MFAFYVETIIYLLLRSSYGCSFKIVSLTVTEAYNIHQISDINHILDESKESVVELCI